LGTRFTVRRFERAGEPYTAVTVQESRVELCQRAGEECVRLAHNQQARASQQGLSPIETVDAAAQAAWFRGQLVVDDQPLTQVLHTLSRHHQGLLRYDEAALVGLQVSGVLPLDDIDRAFKALASSQPIEVGRFTPLVIRVTRKP
jgi:transmembrane sensor